MSKMADELKEDTSVLEGLLSTTDQLESLESLDAAFTTNTGSFRQRHVSESVSLARIFFSVLAYTYFSQFSISTRPNRLLLTEKKTFNLVSFFLMT